MKKWTEQVTNATRRRDGDGRGRNGKQKSIAFNEERRQADELNADLAEGRWDCVLGDDGSEGGMDLRKERKGGEGTRRSVKLAFETAAREAISHLAGSETR